MRKGILCGIFLLFASAVCAQQVYISRYIPDFPTNADNPEQEVEIFNDSRTKSLNLEDHFLITRSYIVQFPSLTIPPRKSMKFGMKGLGMGLYKSILDIPNYKPRIEYGKDKGDFVILLTPDQRTLDAFYFSDKVSVDFLPVSETLTMPNGGIQIPVSTPPESHEGWAYLQMVPDPTFSFSKINDTWSPNSREGTLFPATEYRYLQSKYVEGIVSLSWKTRFENDCFTHIVERSLDKKNFAELDRVPSQKQNSSQPLDYEYYDDKVEQNRVYYYRISNVDKFGKTIRSEIVEAETEENPGGFFFDVLSEPSDQGRYLNVRFSSRQQQYVHIMLLDEELRQLAVLFSDEILAEKQNLVIYQEAIPFGIYHILVETKNRRYTELLVVE